MNLYLVIFTFCLMYLSIVSSVEKSSKSSNKNQSVILKKSLMQSKAKMKRGEKGNAKVSNFPSLPAKKKRLRKKAATARKRKRKVLSPIRIVRKDLNNTKLENEVVKKEIADVKKTEKPGSTKVGMFSAMPAKKKIRKRRGKVVRPIRNVQKDLNNTKFEYEIVKGEKINTKRNEEPTKDDKNKRTDTEKTEIQDRTPLWNYLKKVAMERRKELPLENSKRKPKKPGPVVEHWYLWCTRYTEKLCKEVARFKCLKKRRNGDCVIFKNFYVARDNLTYKKVKDLGIEYVYVGKYGRKRKLDATELKKLLGKEKRITQKHKNKTKSPHQNKKSI